MIRDWLHFTKTGNNVFGKQLAQLICRSSNKHWRGRRPFLVPNPKHESQDNKSDHEEGGGEKEGTLWHAAGDVGNKCRINHKGLRCLYSNAQSMENKQGELEILVHEANKIAAITETWCDGTHGWNIPLVYKLFKRNRPNKSGRECIKITISLQK